MNHIPISTSFPRPIPPQAEAPTPIGPPPSDCPDCDAACSQRQHLIIFGLAVPDLEQALAREGQGVRVVRRCTYQARPALRDPPITPPGRFCLDGYSTELRCLHRNILVPAQQGHRSFGLDFGCRGAHACGLGRERPVSLQPPKWIGGRPKINTHEANKHGAKGKTAAAAATADPPAFPAIFSWLRDQNPRLGLPTLLNNKLERFDSPSS